MVVSAVIAAAVFAIDLSLPLGVTAGVPYVALVLISLWVRWRSFAVVMAVVGTVLTVIGYLYSAEDGVAWMVLANRGLALFFIWCTAFVVVRQKSENAALLDGEERLRAVLDTVVDGIITIDRHGCIQSWNATAQDIFGYLTDEVVGRNVKMLMPAPYRDEHDGYIGNYLETGEAKIIGIGREVIGLRKDGSTFPMYLGVGEMQVDGQALFTGIIRDITARKAAEAEIAHLNTQLQRQISDLDAELKDRVIELEVANKELEAFSYSVSHDLRAPLRAITGFSQALQEDVGDSLSADATHYIDRIRANVMRMARLIDDLLGLSRITRADMTLQDIDLSELAHAVMNELQAGDPDRDVNVNIEPGLMARGDRRLLRALLDNLLGNAWKYTGKVADGHIDFGAAQQNGETVYRVKDDGAGFDMAYAGKLFQVFQRLHTMNEFEGSGVGLAIVERVVARHGGRIWAEGTVDVGATFYFTL